MRLNLNLNTAARSEIRTLETIQRSFTSKITSVKHLDYSGEESRTSSFNLSNEEESDTPSSACGKSCTTSRLMTQGSSFTYNTYNIVLLNYLCSQSGVTLRDPVHRLYYVHTWFEVLYLESKWLVDAITM